MEIYNLPVEEGYYSIQPFSAVLFLLNSTVLYYIIPVVTMVAVCIGIYLAWELHELPTWKARKHRLPQLTLITSLTIFGLFVHWVWVVAFFLAFIDWQKLEKALIRIFFFVKKGETLDEVYKDVDAYYDKEDNEPTPPSFWTTDVPVLLQGKGEVLEDKREKKLKKKKEPSKIANLIKNIYYLAVDKFKNNKNSKKK